MQSARSHIPKAPVYNPYDKFPQTDFDAWIGGITGTLRKVLRHEEEPEPQPQEEKWYYRIGDEEGPQINGYGGKETDGESSGEEQLDDSFAAMRARRVKGKARDPREGPGLAAGTINEPIELGSEDEGSDEGVELDVGSDDEELDEEEKYYDSEGEDDPEYERDSARASHRSTRSPTPSRRRRTVVEDPAEEEEDKDEEGQRSSQGGPEEIEDEQEEEEVSGEISTEDSVNTHARPYDLEDEDGDCFGSPLRPLTFENEHAHRRNSPEDDRQEIHDVDEEEQPVSENTAFPLDAEQDELYTSQPLSLPDIWEGPQTYAEDYYSGGDVMHDSVFPLSADALNEHDVNEKASDSGFFLTPGLLTPNGFNVSSPAASDEEQVAVPSSTEKTKSPQLLQDIHDENGKAYNERSNSPLPGSSPLPMSPEFDPEDQYVNNQPSPVYILSDEEEQEQNQFDMREERSSPPPEYEIDDEVDATPDNDYQDVFADTDADVLAADTVIPLGTSDLDIIDEVDVEAENATIYENELSIEEDKLPALEDPVASLQEDGQDNACLEEDAQQNSFALKEPLDDVTNPLEMEAGEALVGLQKTISPLPKPISIPSIETTSRTDLETDSQNINEADVEMVSQSVEIEADVSHSSPLLIGTDVGIAVTVQDIESEETPELMYPENGDVYSVVSVISEEQDELDEDGEYDLDVESIPGTDVVINLYEVEEILTEGRLTIEPEINDSDEGDGFLNVQNVSEHFVTEEFTQDSNDAGPSSEDAPEAPDASVESKLSIDVLTGPEGLSQIGSPSATEVIASTTDNEIRAAPVSADDLPQILSPSDRSSASQTAHDAEIASVPVNEPLPVSEMLDVSASGPGTPQPSLPLLSPAESSHALGDNTSVNDIIDARKHDLGVSTTPDIVQVLDHEKSSVQSIAATISETPALGSQTELSTISSDADDISTTHALAPGTIEEKSFGPPVQLPDTFIAELLTRKGIPVLHADPYPASLSTPTDEAEDGSVTDDEVDEIDQDSIISTEVSSSNSSLEEDKSLTISSELPVQTANEELDETGEDMDMDLQYPPSDEEKTAPASSSGIAHTVADELDFDAEGDIDPDFVESHDVATSGMHIQDDSQVTTEQILAEHTAEPFISSSIPTASQVADIDSHHGIPIYPSVELEENQSEDLPPEIRADIDDAAARISEPVELVTADINDEVVRSDVVESQSELPSAAAPVLTDSTEFASAHVFSSEKPKEKMEEEAIIAQAVNDGSKESMVSAAEEPIGKSESSPPTQDLPSIPPVTDDVDPNRSLSHDTKSPDTGTTRRTKRKRKTPITLRNGSSAALAKDNNIPIISKGKGKKTVVPQDISDTTSTSGASTAAQFLTGSRASSIVSTSTGDGSGRHNPSPTPHRVKDSSPSSTRFAAPPLPPPPPPLPQLMFHNHSKNKAAPIRRPALSVQTELPRAVSRAPSLSQPLAVSSSQAHSPDVGTPDSRSVTPAPSQSPHILRREPSSNSPVTRSHCRYHKISLPEEEDGGTHIFFLVPGCSLVDRKLIKEEEIVDHGDATYDDSIRKVADIETLGINEYVIGVIRMLVGPDKEHEVYFMPKPGEERARKVIHRKSRLRSSISSSASLHSPRTSISNINGNLLSPSSSSVAPVSAAGSSSTNRSSKQWRRQHDREKEADSSLWSEAYSTETDGEESDGEYKGPSKKPKLVHPTDVAETSSQNSHKSLSQGSTQLRESASAGPGPRNKTKRKRPLDPSAAEYKPHEDEGNESFDEALVKPKKNALKRARTSEPNPSTTSKEPERKRKKKTLKMVPYGFHH